MIFVAFMFALGYEKTGLGRRVALSLVKRLGKKTLGHFWTLGLIFGAIYLAVLLLVGVPYLRFYLS